MRSLECWPLGLVLALSLGVMGVARVADGRAIGGWGEKWVKQASMPEPIPRSVDPLSWEEHPEIWGVQDREDLWGPSPVSPGPRDRALGEGHGHTLWQERAARFRSQALHLAERRTQGLWDSQWAQMDRGPLPPSQDFLVLRRHGRRLVLGRQQHPVIFGLLDQAQWNQERSTGMAVVAP